MAVTVTVIQPKRKYVVACVALCLLIFWMACIPTPTPTEPQPTLKKTPYKTKHVILVVIDGVRYSESWGHPEAKHIPSMAKTLAPQGTIFKNFRNEGVTYTISGHAALLTGFYMDIHNGGANAPPKPSYLQLWRDAALQTKDKAWIVSGKAHLDILTKSKDAKWKGRAEPSEDCGEEIDGHKIYLRSDGDTFQVFLKILKTHHPSLAMLALPSPDVIGHGLARTPEEKSIRWERYLASIRESDAYVGALWKTLQADPFYRDKTALFVTHDHGRHLDGHLQDTFDHGDDCEGCRRLTLLALGPDFKRGHVVDTKADQIDIAPTIGHLLGFSVPGSPGRVLKELLR